MHMYIYQSRSHNTSGSIDHPPDIPVPEIFGDRRAGFPVRTPVSPAYIQNLSFPDEKITRIMGNQVSEEEYRRACDIVIDNTGDLTAEDGALAQVDAAIAGLRERFNEV